MSRLRNYSDINALRWCVIILVKSSWRTTETLSGVIGRCWSHSHAFKPHHSSLRMKLLLVNSENHIRMLRLYPQWLPRFVCATRTTSCWTLSFSMEQVPFNELIRGIVVATMRDNALNTTFPVATAVTTTTVTRTPPLSFVDTLHSPSWFFSEYCSAINHKVPQRSILHNEESTVVTNSPVNVNLKSMERT